MIDLYIRNVNTGAVHKIGTEPHDSLRVNEDGSLFYYNMESGKSSEDDYEFCLFDGDEPEEDFIFVSNASCCL